MREILVPKWGLWGVRGWPLPCTEETQLLFFAASTRPLARTALFSLSHSHRLLSLERLVLRDGLVPGGQFRTTIYVVGEQLVSSFLFSLLSFLLLV